MNPRHLTITRGYVDTVHAEGMACQVWTVNDAADMTRAIELGVDGIITNRPDVLAAVLGQPVPTAA